MAPSSTLEFKTVRNWVNWSRVERPQVFNIVRNDTKMSDSFRVNLRPSGISNDTIDSNFYRNFFFEGKGGLNRQMLARRVPRLVHSEENKRNRSRWSDIFYLLSFAIQTRFLSRYLIDCPVSQETKRQPNQGGIVQVKLLKSIWKVEIHVENLEKKDERPITWLLNDWDNKSKETAFALGQEENALLSRQWTPVKKYEGIP